MLVWQEEEEEGEEEEEEEGEGKTFNSDPSLTPVLWKTESSVHT